MCHAQLMQLVTDTHKSFTSDEMRLIPTYCLSLGYYFDAAQTFSSAADLKKHLKQIDRAVSKKKSAGDFGLEVEFHE